MLPQHGHNMPIPYKISLVGHEHVTGEVQRGAQLSGESPEPEAKQRSQQESKEDWVFVWIMRAANRWRLKRN